MDEYVLKPDDFKWIEGVRESIAALSEIFGLIIVVTNQQGIGKGLMTEDDLSAIHQKMLDGIHEVGGKIDKIYHCPHLKEAGSFFRKPMPGMAIKAKKEFPTIDFKRSVMVGDTISDMKFGKTQNMFTTIIETDKKLISANHKIIDLSFNDLASFTRYIRDLTD